MGASYMPSIASHVIPRVKSLIWADNYVELTALLPKYSQGLGSAQWALAIEGSSDQEKPHVAMPRTATEPSKHLASLDDWIAVYMVLMAVYAEKEVNQLPHMLEYIQSIHELSQNIGLAAACAYDEQFRCNRQTNLIPWSQIDSNLWLRVSSIHLATSQVQRAAPYHTQPLHSTVVTASARVAGGRGSIPDRVTPKT